MSKFKLGLTIVFSVFIILGIAVFALSKGGGAGATVPVTVWGYLPAYVFENFLRSTTLAGDKTVSVTYVQKSAATFNNDFVNALANGAGPDIVMLSSEQILQNKNKLYPIPYTSYSERIFKDNFVQEGELFLSADGVQAVPLMIDPMVMYWNRDIFNTAGIAQPPKYWDEILTSPQTLTKIDKSGTITQSAVALGEWVNVVNAKSIVSSLLFQAGTGIVDQTSTPPRSVLQYGAAQGSVPADGAVNYYTQFANPTAQVYSWNRSLPDSLTSFLSGKLAVYFGFASELATIRLKNPNLNFDVAAFPQPRQSQSPVVFGKLYGLALVKQSQKVAAGFNVITQLTSGESLTVLSGLTNLPPVRRALLSSVPTDPYKTVFYKSALISKGWLDPDPQATTDIFKNMIESITSGRARTSDAVSTAGGQLDALLAR